MNISIKSFDLDIRFGSKGITLDVYDTDGTTFLGDLRIGKARIEWCPGKVHAGNGHKATWNDLIAWFVTLPK